jgi:hypothetical protein
MVKTPPADTVKNEPTSESPRSKDTGASTSKSFKEQQEPANDPGATKRAIARITPEIANVEPKRPSYLSDVRGRKHQRLKAPVNLMKDCPEELLKLGNLKTIRADDLKDRDWISRTTETSLRLAESKRSSSPHPDPSEEHPSNPKEEKKKHHINWLALELKQNEDVLLEKIAAGKQKQKTSAHKYGW